MMKSPRVVLGGLCCLALCAMPAIAQMPEVKEKPPMYSYVANWQIPRTHWVDVAGTNASNKTILDAALSDGTLVGYGYDEALVHTADGATHDTWWSSTSMAGLIKVLEQLRGSSSVANSPALDSATKHWDSVWVSRFYNWRSGPYTSGYGHVSVYKLKADASDDAVETVSKNLVVPILEQLLADGAIVEYEIDTQAIHTENPAYFAIVYTATKAEGLDAVNQALMKRMKDHPLSGMAFGSVEDYSAHRDELLRGDGAYK